MINMEIAKEKIMSITTPYLYIPFNVFDTLLKDL